MGAILGFLSTLMGLRTLFSIVAGLGLVAVFLGGQHYGNKTCTAAYELALAKERIEAQQRTINAMQNNLDRMNQIEERHLKEQADDDATIKDLNELIAKNNAAGRNCPRAATSDELRGISRIGKGR